MKPNLVTILLIALAVLVTLQVSSLLKKNPAPDKDLLKENTALRDTLIARSNREAEEKVFQKDKEIAELKETIQSLSQQKQQIIIREKQVPATVNAYSDPELISAAEEWAERYP